MQSSLLAWLARSVSYWHRCRVKDTLVECTRAVLAKAEVEYPLEMLAEEITEAVLFAAVHRASMDPVGRVVGALKWLVDEAERSYETKVVSGSRPALPFPIVVTGSAWHRAKEDMTLLQPPQITTWSFGTVTGRFTSSSIAMQNILLTRNEAKMLRYAWLYGSSVHACWSYGKDDVVKRGTCCPEHQGKKKGRRNIVPREPDLDVLGRPVYARRRR